MSKCLFTFSSQESENGHLLIQTLEQVWDNLKMFQESYFHILSLMFASGSA